jgi:hypothetical protein
MHMALIFAGAVLLASDPTPSIEGTGEATVVKVADYGTPAGKRAKRARHRHTWTVYPVACEAVKFPRSPLCADRPYRHSWYWQN